MGPEEADSRVGARCRSSVVEHSIGNGEVDSSILSGSTTPLHLKRPAWFADGPDRAWAARWRVQTWTGFSASLARVTAAKDIAWAVVAITRATARHGLDPGVEIAINTGGQSGRHARQRKTSGRALPEVSEV